MDEIWEDVPHWPGYQASNQGRIRSIPRMVPYKDGFRRRRGQLLKPRRRPGNAYLHVTLCRDGKGRQVPVAELVAAAFLGPKPPSCQVIRHINDVPTDNRCINLRYGTHSDNKHDEVRNGRHFNAAKTHCKRGHEYSATNTGLQRDSKGHVKRRCLRCKADQQLARYHARKARRSSDDHG